MYDDYSYMRKVGEDKARQSMEENGVDPKRIFEVSALIRTIMDTGGSNEIGFLHGALDAALTVIPHAFELARQKERDSKAK